LSSVVAHSVTFEEEDASSVVSLSQMSASMTPPVTPLRLSQGSVASNTSGSIFSSAQVGGGGGAGGGGSAGGVKRRIGYEEAHGASFISGITGAGVTWSMKAIVHKVFETQTGKGGGVRFRKILLADAVSACLVCKRCKVHSIFFLQIGGLIEMVAFGDNCSRADSLVVGGSYVVDNATVKTRTGDFPALYCCRYSLQWSPLILLESPVIVCYHKIQNLCDLNLPTMTSR